MPSSLKMKKLQLLRAVQTNDLPLVQSLLSSPKMYKVADGDGNNLLHLAIGHFAVFDYLLSIENFPLELENLNGYTALESALNAQCYHSITISNISEYFAVKLIKSGANIHRPRLLHYAIKLNFEAVVRLLIQNGADLHEKDYYGYIPIFLCFKLHKNVELILMLLCSGANPFIRGADGSILFHKVLEWYDQIDAKPERDLCLVLLENIYYYTFDRLGKLKIPLHTYFNDRDMFSRLEQIIGSDYMDQIMVYCDRHTKDCLIWIFELGADDLVKFIKKHPDALRELLIDYHEEKFFSCECFHFTTETDDHADCGCVWWTDISCEFFDLLVESELKSEAIAFISGLDSTCLIEWLCHDEMPEATITKLICYLLSYGLQLHDTDLEWIYDRYGYCELFKICLHMDLQSHADLKMKDVMPRLISGVSADIQEYVEDLSKCSLADLKLLLDYFALPELQAHCRELDDEELNRKLDKMPKVPGLIELSRNSFRKYFIERFNITTSQQFFGLLKSLPIAATFKKIITFETKLYP